MRCTPERGRRVVGVDPNGNQVRKVDGSGTTEYTFDARDRLVEVKVGGSSVARYGYDTQNLRVAMEDAGGSRRVLLDGIEEYAEVDSSAGTMVARYTHDVSRVDALLAQARGGVKTHAVTDALGSVYGLTDAGANAVTRYSYDVYGARAAEVEGVPTSWGYTGRRGDPTGQMYYRARYYEPAAGRFGAVDPLGPFADFHGGEGNPIAKPLYQYVGGNPARFADPYGLFMAQEHTDITTVAGVAIGLPMHEIEEIVDANNAVDRDQFRGWKHWMKSGSLLTDVPNMVGLAVNWALEGGALGGQLCIPEHGTTNSAAEVAVKAGRWIQDNQALAAQGLCTGNSGQAMESFGRLLHTVQDRHAHKNHENGEPSTAYEHCRQRMDTPDYSHLWEADFAALVDTMKYMRWFAAERRHFGR